RLNFLQFPLLRFRASRQLYITTTLDLGQGPHMYLTGADLIDMTLKQLEMLEEFLRADASAYAEERDAAARDASHCREATDAIRALIPRLAAARATPLPKSQLPLHTCA